GRRAGGTVARRSGREAEETGQDAEGAQPARAARCGPLPRVLVRGERSPHQQSFELLEPRGLIAFETAASRKASARAGKPLPRSWSSRLHSWFVKDTRDDGRWNHSWRLAASARSQRADLSRPRLLEHLADFTQRRAISTLTSLS